MPIRGAYRAYRRRDIEIAIPVKIMEHHSTCAVLTGGIEVERLVGSRKLATSVVDVDLHLHRLSHGDDVEVPVAIDVSQGQVVLRTKRRHRHGRKVGRRTKNPSSLVQVGKKTRVEIVDRAKCRRADD